MKKSLVIFWTVIIGVVLFSACNKYEEGPSFSLLSATKRITGTWLLTETILNDTAVDLMNLGALLGDDVSLDSLMGDIQIDPSQVSINSVKIIFEKDGDGNMAINLKILAFPYNHIEYIKWKFDADKENVDITIMDDLQSFKILRLTNKDLWLLRTETEDGVTTKFLMKMEKEK